MFATVECEATIFGFTNLRLDVASGIPLVLALPGADHVLAFLPSGRWALLSHIERDDAIRHFNDAALPAPGVVITAPASDQDARERSDASDEVSASAQAPIPLFDSGHYVSAVAELGTDAAFSLAFADSPDGVAAARSAGLQVIGVAAVRDPDELGDADLVIPSLLSVRVLGVHPFIVMEVDAIPDLGTGSARRR